MLKIKKEASASGRVTKTPDYKVEVKYSPESIEHKLVRFTTKKGGSFEISADEMLSILMNEVNTETLSAAFVDVKKVNVVNVQRQLVCKLTEDKKKGDIIRLNYTHPYPLEFAIIEESMKLAAMDGTMKAVVLTKKMIDGFKKRITPNMHDYVKKIYQSHKQLDLEKKG